MDEIVDVLVSAPGHPVGQLAGGFAVFAAMWRFFLGPLYDVTTRRAVDAERYNADADAKIAQLRTQVDELLQERRALQDQLTAQKIAHDLELYELRVAVRELREQAEQRDAELEKLRSMLDRRLHPGTPADRRTTDKENPR